MQIVFPHDQNISLELPDNFLLDDGNPYLWFDQFRYIPNIEPILRSCVSSLILLELIDATRNIVDSGAFIGDNSLPWAKMISGRVYAIDPSPTNIRLIGHIAELNNIKNIECIQEVLSRDAIELSFNGSIDFNCFTGVSGAHKIRATTLDSLYSDGVIDAVDFVHLDVEGSELDVISGGLVLIEELQPIIVFEQHVVHDEKTLGSIVKILESLDYVIYMIDEISGANLDCRNFLAIPGRLFARFASSFPLMDSLLRASFWPDEIRRINAMLGIERSLAMLGDHCRHGYELSKMKTIIEKSSPRKV